MARKILFYTHAFGGGGAETVFARLAQHFAERGDDVMFVADYAGPLPVVSRPNLRHAQLGAGHAQAIRRLAKLLREEKPDASFSALGAHNLKHLAAALLAGRHRHCVLGYHGFADAEPKRLSQISFWATALTTRIAARTICVSDALLADVRSRWRASPRRTMRIYNPVPEASAPIVAKDDPPLILGCGRLVPGKRFPDLVAALSRVKPATARLVICGEGPEREAIRAAIAYHGLETRVTLAGHVAEMSPWYRRAACVAIASESESFGLTAAEALAHDVPIVATNCGGLPEVLDNGRYGRIVPVGDVAAMAAALTQTLSDDNVDQGRLARAALFNIEIIHRAYADLTDSLA